jgi:hypothetical protein
MTRARAFTRGLSLVLLIAGCGTCGRRGGALLPKGGESDPLDGTWVALHPEDGPAGQGSRLGIWSGTALYVWGGAGGCLPLGLCAGGARYDLGVDAWVPLPDVGAPEARDEHATAWTSKGLFVWGGRGCGGLTSPCGDGALYDPVTNDWASLPGSGAPAPRGWAVAVSTGTEVVVWGGEDPTSGRLWADGARCPIDTSDAWRAMATIGAPAARRYHTVVWTGSEALVWGGDASAVNDVGLADGGAYDPAKDRWRRLSDVGAPPARWAHTAVWSGAEMLVWGGLGCASGAGQGPVPCGDGARYEPTRDRWSPISASGAPSARVGHSAVWTGKEMIVWGGAGPQCASAGSAPCSDGAAYDPVADRWRGLVTSTPVRGRTGHIAAWTGRAMMVWGGTAGGGSEVSLLDGALFTPSSTAAP